MTGRAILIAILYCILPSEGDGSKTLKIIAFSAGGGSLVLILLIVLVAFFILRRR